MAILQEELELKRLLVYEKKAQLGIPAEITINGTKYASNISPIPAYENDDFEV